MSRLLIASICLLALAQGAHAQEEPKSLYGDRPAWSQDGDREEDYAPRDQGPDYQSTDHGAGYGPKNYGPGHYEPRDYRLEKYGPREYGPGHHGEHSGSRGELAALGERLFFDKSLSGSGHTACSTCHDPRYGFAERRPVSIFDTGKRGPRNAPTIIDVAHAPTIMWDGRIRTIEEQALFPFSRAGEMGVDVEEVVERLREDPGYARLFEAALGEQPTAHGIGRAIGAFERTIVSGGSPFDRFWSSHDRSALGPLAHDGLEVFTGKGRCASCHDLDENHRDKPLLSDFKFRNLGVGFRHGRFEDSGRAKVTHRERDEGAFRTPSLRNVALTAPYMHDGSLRSLEEVVEFYDDGGRDNPNLDHEIHPLHLSEHEKEALVAFLRSLTDPEYARGAERHSSRD